MTAWYESLDVKERRPFRLVVRKVMKATGFLGSNQNLDIYADSFLSSEFGDQIQQMSMWDNSHMVSDKLKAFMLTPEGDASTLGVKQDPGKDNVEQLYKPKMDYYDAEKIRKTSFGQRMLDKQRLEHKGIGSALMSTASEGLQARVKMMKKYADPMNWLKSIPGFGRHLSLGYGNLTGRSQSDLNYFAGVKKKRILTASDLPVAMPQKVAGESGKSTEVLTKMLEFMRTTRTEDLALAETQSSYDELNELQKQSNHKEIMDVLLSATKKKNTAQNSITKEAKKRKPVKEVKTKDLVPKKAKEAIEKKITPSTTESVGTIVKNAGTYVATASRYVAPVAVAGLGAALGAAEAGTMGYSAANRGTKNNKIIPVEGKVDLENMTLAEIQQRQSIRFGAANEKDKLFAVGKYQLIPDTLSDAIAKLKLDTNQKFTAELQEKIFKEYLIVTKRPEIGAYLNSPIEDSDLLWAALKATSLEWASVADPEIAGGKTSHYGSGNKASITVDQMASILMKQRKDNIGATAEQVTAEPVAPTPKTDVSKASVENDDLWKSMKASKKTVINYYGQNTSAITQKSIMFNSGPMKREPHPITGIPG